MTTEPPEAATTLERMPHPHEVAYQTWQADPTPRNLRAVVDALRPSVDYAVRQTGQSDDPYLRAKAQGIVAEAVKTYKPDSGAGLHTWASQQLIRLRRVSRQANVATRLPERTQLDAYALAKAEADYYDQYDREPDLSELSDATGLTRHRIQEVRRAVRRTPSEAALGDLSLSSQTPDHMPEALDAVYDELDATDRVLLEMKTGYGGKYDKPLTPAEISKKLNLSISQVSRRSARIAFRIQEIESALNS